jgi:transcriptional regulator with XRE-family HTH domain
MELSRESLYRILSGNPTLENIIKLAAALDISVAELFEEQASGTIACPKCGARLEIKAKE